MDDKGNDADVYVVDFDLSLCLSFISCYLVQGRI